MANGFMNIKAQAAPSASAVQIREAAPWRILVVDDEQPTREICRTVAETIGMKAWDAGTAEESLELLESSSIDILLTDLLLPGTSGLELLRQVTVMHPDVAVVMMTQYGSIGSAVEATRVGAADRVTKPFCVDELHPRERGASAGGTAPQQNRTAAKHAHPAGNRRVPGDPDARNRPKAQRGMGKDRGRGEAQTYDPAVIRNPLRAEQNAFALEHFYGQE
jgi:CheY-like chemotaxis protein